MTVNVPAGAQNETVVIFRNRVRRGFVKLCKAVTAGSQDALGSKTFTMSYSYVLGRPISAVVAVRPGECSLPSEPIPVIDANGNPALISIDETAGPGFVVDNVHVQGAAGPFQTIGCPTATPFGCFPLGAGTNVVTFTNRSTGLP